MDINIGPLVLTIKEALGAFGVVFFAGGIWREVLLVKTDQKEIKVTLKRYGKYLMNDRETLIKITEQHNMNHKANIQIPAANGPAT
jgi:hypothetical protein